MESVGLRNLWMAIAKMRTYRGVLFDPARVLRNKLGVGGLIA